MRRLHARFRTVVYVRSMAQEGVPRELRLAPVMTGGTSLAVWMGGVTSEVYALLRAVPVPEGTAGPPPRESIYTHLLAATHTVPVVDVVTGTSAGGLNGMLLAVAVHLGLPVEQFDKVRETWMNEGDLASLLRSPGESDPPSLLRGDSYFQVRIEDVLEDWWAAAMGSECDVDLLTTYTRVRPTPVVRVDNFDEQLNEVSYAGTLRFDHEQLADADEAAVRRKLAIAARTSAGIPGVFEPSFLPSNATDARAAGRPDFSPHQPPEVRGLSRWAVDGGVMVNLPLRYVIDRIFGQRSAGRVRRVVLYVSPTPADALPREPDQIAKQPTIAASAITVVNAPRAEGIAADVDAIGRSNDAVERQRQARRSIGGLLDLADAALLDEVYDAYRRSRSNSSVRRVSAMLASRFQRDDRFDETQFGAALMAARPDLLPPTIDDFVGGGRPWGWGIATIEQAASTVLGLLNQALEVLAARRDPAGTADDAVTLGAYKLRVHDQLTSLARLRRSDDQFWIDLIQSIELPPRADAAERAEIRRRRYDAAYAVWPVVGEAGDAAEPERVEVFEQLRAAHREIVRVLLEATPLLSRLAESGGAGFRAELRASLGGARAADDASLETVERRMLRFHVVATQTIGGLKSREQSVELMQISSNAPNLLDPSRRSSEKLVGPELGRLGAFLKESWRANDWMWGRMDGAARLCRVLVDPRRIWELYLPGEAEKARKAFGISDDDPDVSAIETELTELLRGGEPTGGELPSLVRAVTRQRQLAIAREEIPQLCDAIDRSARSGGNETASRRFYDAAKEPGALDADAAVVSVVEKLRIGDETAATELGSRLMVRNLTRAATVGTNAITGADSGLPAVRGPLRALRAPLRFASAVIGTLTSASPLARGLTAMILAAAGAIIALRLAGVELGGLLVGAATVVFVGVAVVSLVRLGVWRFALLVAVLAVPFTMAMVGGDLREVFFDQIEVTRVQVGDAVRITFGSEVRVDVRDPSFPWRGSESVVVGPDTVTALLVGATEVSVGYEPVPHWWKSVFIADWRLAPFTWAMFVVALWCLVRAIRRPSPPLRGTRDRRTSSWRRVPWRRIGWVAGAIVAVGLGVTNQLLAERLLTGRELSRGRRATLVDWAASLADHQVVVLLVLVAVGTVVGLGASGVNRSVRRRWQR